MKKCTTCKIEKEDLLFIKNRNICKECIKIYKKSYYINNKDKIKEKSKKYNENNEDKIKENSKKYRENNKDKIKEK